MAKQGYEIEPDMSEVLALLEPLQGADRTDAPAHVKAAFDAFIDSPAFDEVALSAECAGAFPALAVIVRPTDTLRQLVSALQARDYDEVKAICQAHST